MANLQLSGVSLAFGARTILKNVTLHLREGSRAALCGINGSGKSTLLRLMAREIEPDAGEMSLSKESTLAYLPQSIALPAGRTLREEAEAAYPRRAGAETAAWSRDKDIARVLGGLGFSTDDYGKQTSAFSSGWKMRIALAKVLLKKADFLLLDEPTNYLDIEARSWLLSFLETSKSGFLLVSHDRFFLDNAIHEVYDLFQGTLKRYTGNYSSYEKQRKAELDELIKRHDEQEAEVKKTGEVIRRFRYKASKAAMVQERIKKLEKMERIEIPENLKKIAVTFPPPPHSGKIALTAAGISKRYGEKAVLSNLDLQLDAGERLIVAGKNGAGKSTLLRILGGKDAGFKGTLQYGAGISAGYFSVENEETLTGAQTVLHYMEHGAPLALLPKIRDMLGAFLFRGDDVYKPLDVLSGGEKSRLALLKMLAKPLNMLVLDEPTNHLDIWTKDILLDALAAFTGTIVFVCHDRAFMERLSTKTLYLEDGKHTLYYGDYRYFLEKTSQGGPAPTGAAEQPKPDAAAQTGSREERKKRQAGDKRRGKQEENLVAHIETLEAGKNRAEADLSKPEVYADGAAVKRIRAELHALEAALEAANAEWAALLENGQIPPSKGAV